MYYWWLFVYYFIDQFYICMDCMEHWINWIELNPQNDKRYHILEPHNGTLFLPITLSIELSTLVGQRCIIARRQQLFAMKTDSFTLLQGTETIAIATTASIHKFLAATKWWIIEPFLDITLARASYVWDIAHICKCKEQHESQFMGCTDHHIMFHHLILERFWRCQVVQCECVK